MDVFWISFNLEPRIKFPIRTKLLISCFDFLTLCIRVAKRIAAPQSPDGLLPVQIHSLFILAINLKEVKTMIFLWTPKLSFVANR
mmetsp:Transcript_14022/g.27861  ORF Transcript_14022/g.27861 Transcript_14022/m.27861 type:complete len:85 (+) Transcript_14022:1666-1920(+)